MEDGYICEQCGLGKVYWFSRCSYVNGKTEILYSFAECEACKDITDIPKEAYDKENKAYGKDCGTR